MAKINLSGFEANRVFIYFLLMTAIVLINGVALSDDQNNEQLLPTIGFENIELNESALRETHFKQLPEVSGTGTYFKIENSDLNVGLSSSVPISIRLLSAGNMIEYTIAPADETLTTNLIIMAGDAESAAKQKTTITLEGLKPNTTYYMYNDSYRNEKAFTTDSKGNYSYEQDLSTKHAVWIQTQASNTYFVRDDATGGDCEGRSIGTWNPNTKTCALTTDLNESVEIDSNNITLDCANHSINGLNKLDKGVYIYQKKGVIVTDCNVNNFSNGIALYSTNNNLILNNTANWNYNHGIYVGGYWGPSSENIIANNKTNSNGGEGIGVQRSNKNYLRDNTANFNELRGIELVDKASNNIITGNTIIGNPSYPDQIHGIGLYNSSNNTLINNTILTNYYSEIGLYYDSCNNNIKYNHLYGTRGVFLDDNNCNNNQIHYNNIQTTNYAIENLQPGDVNAEYNWWGTTDANEIAEKIYDYFDDNNYGIVYYAPWLAAPFKEDLACFNGVKDYDETAIDCGGLICQACEEGRRCLQNSDCISQNCNTLYNICDVPGDLYIEWVKPIQVVEDVPLVAGKATVVRVKVVNDGPEVETDVALNYGNGCFTETKSVLIRAFSSKIVDFYPPNNCTK